MDLGLVIGPDRRLALPQHDPGGPGSGNGHPERDRRGRGELSVHEAGVVDPLRSRRPGARIEHVPHAPASSPSAPLRRSVHEQSTALHRTRGRHGRRSSAVRVVVRLGSRELALGPARPHLGLDDERASFSLRLRMLPADMVVTGFPGSLRRPRLEVRLQRATRLLLWSPRDDRGHASRRHRRRYVDRLRPERSPHGYLLDRRISHLSRFSRARLLASAIMGPLGADRVRFLRFPSVGDQDVVARAGAKGPPCARRLCAPGEHRLLAEYDPERLSRRTTLAARARSNGDTSRGSRDRRVPLG